MGFSFTNTTASTKCKPVGVNLGLATNYSLVKEDPDEVRISNKTAALDQQETISYRFKNTTSVYTPLKVTYPAPNQSAVKYNIRLDDVYRETVGDGYIDHPIAVSITFDHELASCITESVVDEMLTRLLGACYSETDESFRFMDMARGGMQPVAN